MPAESAADLAAMFGDDFAVLATWTHAGADTSLMVIFDAAHMAVDLETGAPVSTSAPQITVRDADLPAGAAQGDAVIVAGKSWKVRDLQPDGTGVTVAMLEEA